MGLQRAVEDVRPYNTTLNKMKKNGIGAGD
jgi:hypothetical protein